MKIGVCSVTFREKSVDEIIELSKKVGLDCIEWGGDIHVVYDKLAEAKVTKEKTLNNGLRCDSYGSYYFMSDISDFEKVSITAKELGAKVIRIWTGEKDAEEFTNDEFTALVEKLKKCADIAKKNGQILAFEYHYRSYNNSAENSIKLIDAIGKDNVKTYWQPMYWRTDLSKEELIKANIESIRKIKDRIVNVHVYQWKDHDRFLLSEGLDEWKLYVKELPKDINAYLEFVKDDSEEIFIKDVETLKKIIGEK